MNKRASKKIIFPLAVLSFIKLAIHLGTNAFASYGIFPALAGAFTVFLTGLLVRGSPGLWLCSCFPRLSSGTYSTILYTSSSSGMPACSNTPELVHL
jgi:hypothetical protein